MWAALVTWAGGAYMRLLPYILTVAAVVAVAAGIYRRGGKAAEAASVARQKAATINSMKERANVETDMLGAPDGAAADELRDHWSRD